MPPKPKREVDATNADLDLCFLSGVSFLESASQFFDRLPLDVDDAARVALAERGRLFVAATNLALSVELLLKALAIARKRKVLPEHTLDALFAALPSDYQASVEWVYRQDIGSSTAPRCTVLRLYVTPKGKALALDPTPPVSGAKSSVADLLLAERDSFKLWRYIHESGTPAGTTHMTIQHYYLRMIAAVLIKHFALDTQSHRILRTMCFSPKKP